MNEYVDALVSSLSELRRYTTRCILFVESSGYLSRELRCQESERSNKDTATSDRWCSSFPSLQSKIYLHKLLSSVSPIKSTSLSSGKTAIASAATPSIISLHSNAAIPSSPSSLMLTSISRTLLRSPSEPSKTTPRE